MKNESDRAQVPRRNKNSELRKESLTMKTNKIALALSAAFAMTAAGVASAATATTDSINPTSSSDSTNDVTYLTSGFTSSSNSIGDFTAVKYNGGQVLVGATFSATLANESVSFSQSESVPGTPTPSPTASAYGSANLSVGGIAANANSATINSGTIGSSGTTGTISAYTVTGTATTQSQLNNLYGSGNVAGTVTEALYISKTGGNNAYTVSVNNSGNRTASVDYTYQTAAHANGSFAASPDTNSLTLSFGNVVAGSTPTSQTFDLYNLIGSWGLQVVSATYSGSSLFTLGGVGTGITNLAAGSFVGGVVNMASTLAAGNYTGFWTIVVGDSASGIAAGRNFGGTDTLTLNVSAQVAAVPEPGEWAMMLAGFGLIGLMAKRKRRRSI
jgi:hypothetical protein